MHRHLPFAGLAPRHQQTRSAVIIVKSQYAPTLRTRWRAKWEREREREREREISYSMRFSEAMQVNNSRTLRRSLNGRWLAQLQAAWQKMRASLRGFTHPRILLWSAAIGAGGSHRFPRLRVPRDQVLMGSSGFAFDDQAMIAHVTSPFTDKIAPYRSKPTHWSLALLLPLSL